jgi:hypothetical protein
MTWSARGLLLAAAIGSSGVPVDALVPGSAHDQQSSQPTIRGTVLNAQTNSPVADASVTLVEANLTVKTSQDGRFEFAQVAPRSYTLTVSTIGYIFVRRQVDAAKNHVIEITVPLAEGTGTHQEAVKVAADATTRPKALGVSSQMELGSAGLAELRGVATDDPMRAVQALPGVATGDDFQAEFSVRGSAYRHVGIVLDGSPTQQLMHSIRSANDSGSIAMINGDILGRAALFGGPHPRPHGDWLGATLEFDAREGSRDRAGLRAAISGTGASGVFEGPIGRRRQGSWLVSLRKSYLDWLIRKINPDADGTIGFSDAQVKLVYDFTPRQQVQFFSVLGDATYRDDSADIPNDIHTAQSRSVLGSVAWRYAHPRAILTQRLTFIGNISEQRGVVGQPLADGRTNSFFWRADLVMPMSKSWTAEGGARLETTDASEMLRNFQSTSPTAVRLRFERSTSASPLTSAAWGQVTWRGDKGGLSAGLRLSDRSTGHTATQPWLLGETTLHKLSIRGGVGQSAQYIDPIIHALAPGGMTPEGATSYDVSLEHPIGRGLHVQGTLYYRTEHDVLRRSGEERVDPVTGLRIPESVFPAFTNSLKGSSRGFDLLLIRRSTSPLNGWIGYTWSKTHYDDTATGEAFDGDFDQRHTLNVFLQQRLSYRLAVSGKLRIGSNVPIVGYFSGRPEEMFLASVRNAVRLPLYARLDVRANRTFTFERSRLTLFVEVMNLLGRDNGGQSDGFVVPGTRRAIGYVEGLLPRVPSAGLLFEF